MDNKQCDHSWVYTGSKRQDAWECVVCKSLRFSEPREFIGLTDEEILSALGWGEESAPPEFGAVIAMAKAEMIELGRRIEAKLKEKNNG